MVARDAHILGIVFLGFVWAVDYLPLLAFLVELNLLIVAYGLALVRTELLLPLLRYIPLALLNRRPLPLGDEQLQERSDFIILGPLFALVLDEIV